MSLYFYLGLDHCYLHAAWISVKLPDLVCSAKLIPYHLSHFSLGHAFLNTSTCLHCLSSYTLKTLNRFGLNSKLFGVWLLVTSDDSMLTLCLLLRPNSLLLLSLTFKFSVPFILKPLKQFFQPWQLNKSTIFTLFICLSLVSQRLLNVPIISI